MLITEPWSVLQESLPQLLALVTAAQTLAPQQLPPPPRPPCSQTIPGCVSFAAGVIAAKTKKGFKNTAHTVVFQTFFAARGTINQCVTDVR